MQDGSSRALRPLALSPLPLGSIRPRGWLQGQLRIQADGLSGHLDTFWPDVADSGWIGGQAEGWERGPYWLDGMVPLAYTLGDARLVAKVRHWVDHVLDHQQPDGWLGPIRDRAYGDKYEAYDPWPAFVFLKALTQYAEATGDERVVPAMSRFLRRLGKGLARAPLRQWAHFRWADLVLSIHWLYERTGEGWLLDLAASVRTQGYDWRAHFGAFRYTGKTAADACTLATHVVNNAMALKQPAVWYRQSGNLADRDAIWQMLHCLDTYHGQATGLFTGDEHYAGRDPSQGTELCAVVEYLYALETLLGIVGDARLGDRLERIAYNALPGTFSPDMWAHQYDQQANGVVCCVAEDRIYVNNGPDANIYGLAPNYGCCTANMHQGWPKLASHLWMRSPDDGLVAVAYAPSSVELSIRGVPVRVSVDTAYPFGDTLHFVVQVDQPLRFPLRLRVPSWAEAATVTIAGGSAHPAQEGSFHALDREWSGDTEVTLSLPMSTRVRRGYNNSASILRGPLVYSLRIGEDWRRIGGDLPHADWEVHPTTPWNYALQLDPAHPERSVRFEERGVGICPFSPEGAPVVAHASGRRLPSWRLKHHAAGPLPQSPVSTLAPIEALELLPYGCTHLRVTEFPVLAETP